MKTFIKVFITLTILVVFWGCSGNSGEDFVFVEFKEQLSKMGIKIDSVDRAGFIYLNVKGSQLKVSLENVRRDFERDHDTATIAHYAGSFNFAMVDTIKSWNEIKDSIYISLFPSDYNFAETVHEKVTENVEKIYGISTQRNFVWVRKSDLKAWNIAESDLVQQANINGDKLLMKSKIIFDTIEHRKLGMLETDDETLKAALLFAPSMREKVKKDFSFPFYAVIPVRDFCYIFSEKDFDFFSERLGTTVLDEYQKSGHPITTEILKFSDKGVEAIGSYQSGK